jgi:hypothetical protein
MHKFKPEGDIGGNQRSKHFKPLLMGARAFIQTTKKGDAFFVYAILALDLRTQQHEIPIQYQDYKDIFERKMQTHYLNIGHMIVRLTWKKEHNPYLNPFITCCRMNF